MSNDSMFMNDKLVRKWSWPLLRCYSSICPEGLRNITKTSIDSRSLVRSLNSAPRDYEASVQTVRKEGPSFGNHCNLLYSCSVLM